MTHSLRQDAIEIWQAGLRAVDATRLVAEHVRVQVDGDVPTLIVGEGAFPLSSIDRILVVGAGKAGAAMARGFEEAVAPVLRTGLPIEGLVNVPEGTEVPLSHIRLEATRPPGVNEPTPRGVAASREIVRLVRSAGARDLCIVLLSGGGSALMPLPAEGISLDDKLRVTRWLSGAGANIEELNIVRKHLSDIKGGRLAAAGAHLRMVTLVISDVLGDPLDLIASGPTVRDESTASDALGILSRFDPERQLPASIYGLLQQRSESAVAIPQSTGGEHSLSIIGNNAVAVDGAGVETERRGYSHAMTSARRSEGNVEGVGRGIAEMACAMLRREHGEHGPDCLISGGEPTVVLAPETERGRGGRNQQLVLAALDYLAHCDPPLSDQQRDRIVILSAGTDGEDGPTDAAGAFLDNRVWRASERLGLDPREYLRRNDAYTFFQSAGGLLTTGPTGTNVCDVRVALVSRARPAGHLE